MSISKAQANALADGFLDNFGSTKDGLQPRETYSEIIVIAGELVEDMQENLNKGNKNASGNLSESIIAGDPEKSGNLLSVDISMAFYGQFINKGVKGTRGGAGPYAFKYDLPSKSMVDAIREWQKSGKAKSANVNKSKSTSANEKKNASISEIDSAFAIARSIVQKGIKANGFLDEAVTVAEKKVSDRMGAALKIDILNSL